MNFINIIIIGGTLFALIIVIIVITRSLKNVDEKIVEELKSKGDKKRGGFFLKARDLAMSFFELIIKKTKKNIQSLHSWVIKEKKKNKSDIIKARDELIIEKDDEGVINYDTKKNEIQKKSVQKKPVDKKLFETGQKKIKNNDSEEKEDIAVFYEKKKEVSIDSLAVEKNNKNITEKSSFMKSLFKKNKQNKKIVDIHDSSIDKWTLDEADTSGNIEKQANNSIEIAEVGRKFTKSEEKKTDDRSKIEPIVIAGDNDEMIGVDRKILERKILQKIDKNPKELNNYRELGDLYIKMKKLDDALEVFGYVLSVKPRDLVALRRKRKIKLLRRIAK